MAKRKEKTIGPFRWRGKLNWKDIAERLISGLFAGLAAGLMIWALSHLS